MEPRSKFRIPLSDLERSARTDPDEVVEMVGDEIGPPPDPRGPEPDRDWFASGG